jgi:hypothetical protein
MAQKRLKKGSKICKILQYFAKNARFFEDFCKILHFFDTHFNPPGYHPGLKVCVNTVKP